MKLSAKRKNRELKREERRRKANQIRTKKRDDVLTKKRSLGGSDNSPFLVAVVPLGECANSEHLLKLLKSCDSGSTVKVTQRNVLHIRYD